jgi:putative membrane protein
MGCIVGLLAFSHFLAWVFNNFRNATIALLTGFILGSLIILWPWKTEFFLMDNLGDPILKNGEKVIKGYEWFFPNMSVETLIAFSILLVGIVSIWFLEFSVKKLNKQ